MTYQEYLRSEDWQTKRREKLKRTSRCAICAATTNLDVHHLNYRDLFNVALSDLRVLCRPCHTLAHGLHRTGCLRFTSTNHHSRFALTKAAVKAALGLTGVNCFR